MIPILRFFKLSGALEALSYLLLLFVAMPLKYYAGKPIFVRWVGTFHGAFFVLFCLAVALAAWRQRWSLKVTAQAFLSSLFPFGPFIFERYVLNRLRPPGDS